MTNWIRVDEDTVRDTEFSSITGRIISITKKDNQNGSYWYRCEVAGYLTTNNKLFRKYERKHKLAFTIAAKKNLKVYDLVFVIGNVVKWTSPNDYDVYSLDAAYIGNGDFSYKQLMTMLTGVEDDYTPIKDLDKVIEQYKQSYYTPEKAVIDICRDVDSQILKEFSDETRHDIKQALRADTNDMSRNLVKAEVLPYVGRDYNLANRLYETYGFDAMKAIKDNPWELWFTIPYMQLDKCDGIAQRLELDITTDPRRMNAIVRHGVETETEELGYTYLPREFAQDLYTKYFSELMDYEEYEQHLTQSDQIMEIPQGYQVKPLYHGENRIIEGVRVLVDRTFEQHTNVPKQIGDFTLTDEQYDAVLTSLETGLFILTGGPGVGKTTTLKSIINAHIDEFQLKPEQILLMAPTGKAAQRMSEQTGMRATTVHKRLGLMPGAVHLSDSTVEAYRQKHVRLIIIDEASMLDTELAAAAFELATRINNCKLILVGDKDQLPSIGPGQVLRDLLNADVPSKELTVIKRQSEDSAITELAAYIRNGKFPDQSWFDTHTNVYFATANLNNIILTLQNYVLEPKKDELDSFQMITPYRNQSDRARRTGSPDVDTVSYLNYYTQEYFNPGDTISVDDNQYYYNGSHTVGRKFKINDRVICKINKTDTIVNGSIGHIVSINTSNQNPDLHCIKVDFDGEISDFFRVDGGWSAIELAYAITVHQSQGSEYNTVIVPIVRRSGYNTSFLNRNILYTAITRAKTNLVLLGSIENYATIASIPAPIRITRLQEELGGTVEEPIVEQYIAEEELPPLEPRNPLPKPNETKMSTNDYIIDLG